ncbi:hypothetical protein ACFWWM_26815 [Streptomyces sp. NPDC058682]|uniref:hypothetical protein n=1 Tax=Streptomyces sp. NPDC058682 TaxID=3346596 RepID=UPI00365EBCA5
MSSALANVWPTELAGERPSGLLDGSRGEPLGEGRGEVYGHPGGFGRLVRFVWSWAPCRLVWPSHSSVIILRAVSKPSLPFGPVIALRSLFWSCGSSPFIVPRVALRVFGWMVSCRAHSTALIASLYAFTGSG